MKTKEESKAFDLNEEDNEGLTKLEYFAAAAMQGMLAKMYTVEADPDDITNDAVNYAKYLIMSINDLNIL